MTDLTADTSTYFAPAGRDLAEALEHKRTLLLSVPLLQSTIDAMSDVVLILNGHRQIISVNQALLKMLDCTAERVLGKRPGELLGCQNAATGPDGCGTCASCEACGAVNAILDSQKTSGRVTRECRVSLVEPVGGALDLSVSAMGVDIDGERFVICVLKDISDQKRLAVLARMFFHDVMNTAGSIRGFAELLREHAVKDSPEDEELALLTQLANQLVEEIQAQRDLTYAETGDLEPEFAPVDTLAILERVRATYARHVVARNRGIELCDVWKGSLITDERLLGRVLANMIKNALEATRPGGKIKVGCYDRGAEVVFTVQNEGVMPKEVQFQVFQRSFSTKARLGRGIGTHSMKLLGERYLSGRVTFTSRAPEGTIFSLTLPKVALGTPP